MYLPPHFAFAAPEELHRLVRDHPLGALVRSGPAGLDADHLPFEFDPAAGPWNYEVVHAHGTLTVRDDERFVRALVARLTRRHEAAEPVPWKMGDAPPAYLNDMLGRIVGLEIQITAWVGKGKLGQNREARDRLHAAEVLATRGHDELAQRMQDVDAAGNRTSTRASREQRAEHVRVVGDQHDRFGGQEAQQRPALGGVE